MKALKIFLAFLTVAIASNLLFIIILCSCTQQSDSNNNMNSDTIEYAKNFTQFLHEADSIEILFNGSGSTETVFYDLKFFKEQSKTYFYGNAKNMDRGIIYKLDTINYDKFPKDSLSFEVLLSNALKDSLQMKVNNKRTLMIFQSQQYGSLRFYFPDGDMLGEYRHHFLQIMKRMYPDQLLFPKIIIHEEIEFNGMDSLND